jgi:hypothetical protein
MKKLNILTLALLMVGLLTACGGKTETAQDVDLTAYYDSLAETYEWGDGYMVDIEGEMLDSYYPGLSDISTKQFIAKMPIMSAVVNEVVLMECESEEDAASAAAILQDRITTQAEGGAWYPESMEAWEKAQVVQQGNYVAMLASASYQDELVDSFNQLFA